jgi:hypothetical protein
MLIKIYFINFLLEIFISLFLNKSLNSLSEIYNLFLIILKTLLVSFISQDEIFCEILLYSTSISFGFLFQITLYLNEIIEVNLSNFINSFSEKLLNQAKSKDLANFIQNSFNSQIYFSIFLYSEYFFHSSSCGFHKAI